MRRSPHSRHDRGSISLPDTKTSVQARVPNQQPPSPSGLKGSPPDSCHLCHPTSPQAPGHICRYARITPTHSPGYPCTPVAGAFCAHWTCLLSGTVHGSLDKGEGCGDFPW